MGDRGKGCRARRKTRGAGCRHRPPAQMIGGAIETIARGLGQSFLMAYQVWWALVLGFAISAVVQAWVPRERIESALSGSGPRPVVWATGLGAASSSCSYAAIAIAKSLFQK